MFVAVEVVVAAAAAAAVVVVEAVASEAAEAQCMIHMELGLEGIVDVRVERGWKASVAAALVELKAVVLHKD